jgi:hypothetical protein
MGVIPISNPIKVVPSRHNWGAVIPIANPWKHEPPGGSTPAVTIPPDDQADDTAPDEGGVDRTEARGGDLDPMVHCGASSGAEDGDDQGDEDPAGTGKLTGFAPAVRRRRTKLDLPMAFRIVDQVKGGKTLTDAARLSGVARSTVQSWLARGRAGEPGFQEFVRAIEQAEGDHAQTAP